MTREDAISIMKVIVHMLEEKYDTDRVEDAVDMAIKALEQEPCEDTISRDEVLKQINCWIGSGEYRYTNATDYLTKRVSEISSIQPKTDVLDKIRTEIEQMNNIDYVKPVTVDEVLQIIDKYKAEKE